MTLMKREQYHSNTKGDTGLTPRCRKAFLLLFLFTSIIFSGFIVLVSMLLFLRFLLFKPREQESRQARRIIQSEKQKPDISARF